MARDEAPPFELGQTYFQGNTPDTAVGNQLLGKIWTFEDIDLNASGTGGTMKPRRTGCYRHMMAVRNTSGGLLVPKRLGLMSVSGSLYEFTQEISGYADTVGQVGYPIDEFLPAAGVADDDIFWVCVGGPAMVQTDASGDTNIGIGKYVIPATTGYIVEQNLAVSDGQDTTFAALFNQIQGAVGRTILAVNATHADCFIYVAPKLFH
jgi:hypothetical protein